MNKDRGGGGKPPPSGLFYLFPDALVKTQLFEGLVGGEGVDPAAGSVVLREHFGQLFTCMMCFPANFGWVMSLIDWFLLPGIAITPFNIILAGTGYWWLALLLDCCFTTGIVWLVHHVEEWFENEAEKADTASEIVEEEDPDNIEVDDITGTSGSVSFTDDVIYLKHNGEYSFGYLDIDDGCGLDVGKVVRELGLRDGDRVRVTIERED